LLESHRARDISTEARHRHTRIGARRRKRLLFARYPPRGFLAPEIHPPRVPKVASRFLLRTFPSVCLPLSHSHLLNLRATMAHSSTLRARSFCVHAACVHVAMSCPSFLSPGLSCGTPTKKASCAGILAPLGRSAAQEHLPCTFMLNTTSMKATHAQKERRGASLAHSLFCLYRVPCAPRLCGSHARLHGAASMHIAPPSPQRSAQPLCITALHTRSRGAPGTPRPLHTLDKNSSRLG
jgi:hypothetical protein